MNGRPGDEPVFVVDLTREAIEETSRHVEAARAGRAGPRRLPSAPKTPIRKVALMLDGWSEPLLLPVEPTTDVLLLDALGRLLRMAVLAGERVPRVAVEHGGELERRLAFERRLPDWIYEGVSRAVHRRLPAPVRRVLGPRPPSR